MDNNFLVNINGQQFPCKYHIIFFNDFLVHINGQQFPCKYHIMFFIGPEVRACQWALLIFMFFIFFYQGLMWGLVKGGGYFGVLHEANQIIVVVGVQILKSLYVVKF
jgi:hypothetical protein